MLQLLIGEGTDLTVPKISTIDSLETLPMYLIISFVTASFLKITAWIVK